MKTHASTTFIFRSIIACTFLGVSVITSRAAIINWGVGAQNVNPAGGTVSDLDVSNAGTLLGAVVLRPGLATANATVNGVTFTGVNPSSVTSSGVFSFTSINFGFNTPSGSPPFSTLSASYQSLLTTGAQNGFTLTMSSLNVGGTYAFQFWSNQTPSASSSSTDVTPGPGSVTVATAGNSVNLSPNSPGVGGSLGQFAVGTFVADGATQQVVFSGAAIVNGFQLRQLAPAPAAVPEPGSALAGMLALGVCFSGLVKRSRRQTVEV